MVLSTGCISSKRIQDYAVAQPRMCEVHDLPMKERSVPQTFGMRRSGWIMELRIARQELFPHADEVYDTYACLGSYERYARVRVCGECTNARTKWLADYPPSFLYDRQYVRYCDAVWKEFAHSYRGRE